MNIRDKENKMKNELAMNIVGYDGCLKKYEITGDAVEMLMDKMPRGYVVELVDGVISGKGSKSDIFAIERAIKTINAATAESVDGANGRRSTEGKSGRYIELLSVAEEQGLSHGKSWTCTEYNIDTKQLHPSWGGLEICYVYKN